ncbi:hypothetical protein E3T43_07145 [Cryobacterium sp. Hh7]|uniref:hypothetical protein n=1 Tax=Cryobacterium sp. Hh7 TaxID=1259159 RepID=UPI00106B86E1|nr:hypothetical protein [Cryobacterium sp. Hh7]TFD58018.1 hypothetical protein E3T43_07145 [Cryobacterium sp. Hh7]
MAVVKLATSEDVEAALGRSLTASEAPRVGVILDKASELFRDRSGQQFTAGRSTRRFKVNGGKVRLTQRPVTAVVSVTDDDGNPYEFTRFDSVLTIDLRSHLFVRVTYDHGGEVPDLVRLCIADIAKAVLTINPKAVEGLTQYSEATGPFNKSETYATWAIGGATRLAPDDVAFADTFKMRLGSLIVQNR